MRRYSDLLKSYKERKLAETLARKSKSVPAETIQEELELVKQCYEQQQQHKVDSILFSSVV